MLRICATCGKEFESNHSRSKVCSDDCRTIYARNWLNSHRAKQHVNKTCLHCGKEIPRLGTGQARKYCSDQCRQDYTGIRYVKIYQEKTCIVCGRDFLPKSSNHICCSYKCGVEREKELGSTYYQRVIKPKKKPLEAKKCIVCGNSFVPNTAIQKVCGEVCRSSRRFEMNKEYQIKFKSKQPKKERVLKPKAEKIPKPKKEKAVRVKVEKPVKEKPMKKKDFKGLLKSLYRGK